MSKEGQNHDGHFYRDSLIKLLEIHELLTDNCGTSMDWK